MAQELSIQDLPPFNPRAPEAHKGDFGQVLIVACAPGMTGAGALAAHAALRAGAGMVTLGVPRSLNPILEVKCTEATTWPLEETSDGCLAASAAHAVVTCAARMTALAVGPGLGRHKETAEAVSTLVSGTPCPMVVDADGLNALAGAVATLDNAAGPRVLTPHEGEMARLMDLSRGQVSAHRKKIAESFAASHNCIVLLKGHKTVITDGSFTFVNTTGNPGMATGGSGDVLTGIITGLLAQGFTPLESASLGAYLHGAAGDLAAGTLGEVSLIAGDLLDYLPMAIMEYNE